MLKLKSNKRVLMKYLLPIVISVIAAQQLHAQEDLNNDPGRKVKSIYFGGGSYYISAKQVKELQQFIEDVEDLQFYTVTIHSFTDNIGGADYNRWLSQMRAQAALEELLLLDVPIEKIKIHNSGQEKPIYSNQTWAGRYKNRRVDIILWPMAL